MAYAFADIAFTPTVRAQQDRNGSGQYARFLTEDRTGGDRLGPEETAFVEARDGFYQATASETGWPYVQFRGGPRGFLKVRDDRTIAYADLQGNRQYISLGNLAHDSRIALILVDYTQARRLKLWGRVEVIENTVDNPAATGPADIPAERMILIHVEAVDWNCPRHIPRRFTSEEAGNRIAALDRDIAALRAENRALRQAVARAG